MTAAALSCCPWRGQVSAQVQVRLHLRVGAAAAKGVLHALLQQHAVVRAQADERGDGRHGVEVHPARGQGPVRALQHALHLVPQPAGPQLADELVARCGVLRRRRRRGRAAPPAGPARARTPGSGAAAARRRCAASDRLVVEADQRQSAVVVRIVVVVRRAVVVLEGFRGAAGSSRADAVQEQGERIAVVRRVVVQQGEVEAAGVQLHHPAASSPAAAGGAAGARPPSPRAVDSSPASGAKSAARPAR